MRNIFIGIIIIVTAFVFIISYPKQNNSEFHKYVAIGDSYTIGLGVEEKDRWPNILTKHLKSAGIDIQLVANPAVSGFTVRDAIEVELLEVERIKPDFVTVLIGANDNFGQKESEIFRQELKELLDKLQPMIVNPRNIVLITIPDYTKSPAFRSYPKEDMLKLIKEYNEIIKKEVEKRSLVIADIFPISQTMTGDADYVSDGLHPSAEGYIKWEKVIFPVVHNLSF